MRVSGSLLLQGAVPANRSWFGRLIHWRTDYLIRGRLQHVAEPYGGVSGDRVSAGLNLRGTELEGALFLSHPGGPRPIRMTLSRTSR